MPKYGKLGTDHKEIENFKCIFDMFDKDKTKVVNVNDL